MVTISNEPLVPKADAKILRIARPYGGAVVFEADPQRGLSGFFKRTAEWFERAASENDFLPLSLFADEPKHERELAAFRDEARGWPFTGDVRVSYETPIREPDERHEHLPPPVQGQTYPVAAGIERRAVSSFVLHARANEAIAQSESGLMAITYQERTQFIDVELRHPEIAKVRDAATAVSGVAEDVLDILIANAFLNPPNSYGMFSIEVDAILDVRGLAKKRKALSGGKAYTAGHHQNARELVAKAIIDLEKLWVAGSERKGRRGKLPAKSWQKVLMVDRLYTRIGETLEERSRVSIDELDPKSFEAIDYQLGSWFEPLRAANIAVQAPRRLLELDTRHTGPAKDLGRYLVQRRGELDEQGRLVRPVAAIFTDLLWTPKAAGPAATRLRLERPLETLTKARIISSWGYVDDLRSLPGKEWLAAWMEARIWVRF